MRIQKSKYVWFAGLLASLLLIVPGRSAALRFSALSAQSPATGVPSGEAPPAASGETPPETLPRFSAEEFFKDVLPPQPDTTRRDTAHRDTSARKPFLDDVLEGKSKDSLIYNLKTKFVYVYEEGDVKYQKMNLKADYMSIDIQNKLIYAHGRPDTTRQTKAEVWDQELPDTTVRSTRPEFSDGGQAFTMDTITYNLGTKKAWVKGVATHEGEGFLLGEKVKMMPDRTINIAHGRYTTCDADHPHFYLSMTKSSTIPQKKTVFGPSYLVMEDVPIYFLGLPFGFFPMTSGRKSGFLVPSYGEEMRKGFFLRDGGYYFAINDYLDLALTGGFYTMGSWETAVNSRYTKRYRYQGNLSVNYSDDRVGEKGDSDYYASNNFRIGWSHQQDPKFRPGTTFSAQVDISSTGYNKYSAQDLNQYVNSQTNSSINFTKNWAGTPFTLSTNFQYSQYTQDSSVQVTFPTLVFNVSNVNPFQRKELVGRPRWYEKISLTYNFNMTNNIKTKQQDLFTENSLKNMINGINHKLPVKTSFNLLKYFNVTPGFNYNENWFFRKIDKAWDPLAEKVYDADTTYGFYRLYDYNFNVQLSTTVYGTFQFKKKEGLIRAIRHVLKPSAAFSYVPDFGQARFGYYSQVQSDTLGNTTIYSPYTGNAYSVPGRNPSMNLNFGLTQTLEMKVRDRQDTTGMRKIKLIDELGINSSYNFLADSLNLAPFSIRFRTTLYKNIALNLSATLDPYAIDANGKKINRFMIRDGKLGRITNASTSFGYSFNGSKRRDQQPAMNDINSGMTLPPDEANMFAQPGFNDMDPNTQRQIMTSRYYDFSIPWNFGFNYSFSYSKPNLKSSVIQTLGFNGSLNLTDKWALTFTGGYDIQAKKLSPSSVTITRDLHCWQMNFRWIPNGFRQSWSFTIAVKASTLKDLKYDRNRSSYDSLYDQ